jgi:hypothetical protein
MPTCGGLVPGCIVFNQNVFGVLPQSPISFYLDAKRNQKHQGCFLSLPFIITQTKFERVISS